MTALISLVALERADDTDTVTARASASDVEAERARDLAARAATGDPVATRQLLTLVHTGRGEIGPIGSRIEEP